jgi:photosynthetic reaction center H subunit
MQGYVVGSIDVAALTLYAFALFFLCLVFWLRREDRREGYPLEDELTGAIETPGGPLSTASTKSFLLPFDQGTVTAPTQGREPVEVAGAQRRENFGGAPYSPTGSGLPVGVGPGAFAERAKRPDVDAHNRPRIVPIGAAEGITVSTRDSDPRGMAVYGADGLEAGTVADLWVDRAEHVIRYLQIQTATGAVLAPMAMAVIRRGAVVIDAINAADFAGAPKPTADGTITRYDEERVVGYFGAGYLYANSDRQEPWL